MRFLFIFCLALLLFFIYPKNIFAQVYINEFSSFESQGDWVELYATEDTDISNWVLRDTSVSKMKTIAEGTTIGPSTSQYFVVEVGNRLNRDGDKIELRKADDQTVVDTVWYGEEKDVCSPETGQASGKQPDGTGSWVRFSGASKNAANTQGTSPCPNQNTPLPTPKPTATPSPSPIATSSTTPTPMPQIKAAQATPNSTPTSIPKLNDQSLDTKVVSNETVQQNLNDNNTKKSSPYIAYLLVLTGVSSIGAGIYPFAKKRFSEYNKPHDPPPPTFY